MNHVLGCCPRIVAFAVGALLAATVAARAGGAEEEQASIAELREQRQFDLAESRCREQLARGQLDERQRADLAIELIRCLAAHAANSVASDRPPLWQAARQVAAEFQQRDAQHPRGVLVRVQDALTVLAQGELLRQEAELLPTGEASVDAAKPVLREASRLLEQLDNDLARDIPSRHRRADKPGELSADELVSLQRHVRYHQARALQNRALCFPPEDVDRVAMLTQAIDTLKQLLSQLPANDSLAVRSQTELATCYRLAADFANAAQAVAAAVQQATEPDDQLAARAESVRLALARRQWLEVQRLLTQGREAGDRTSGAADLAFLEGRLALWHAAQAAANDSQAQHWRQQSLTLLREIEQTHGPYWGRRADQLLVQAFGSRPATADPEVLTRTADSFYRNRQFDEAITAYEQAASAAAQAGDSGQAFALRYKAALVDHTRQNHAAASRRLAALGREMHDQPKAPDAHLLAAWNAAQHAATEPSAIDDYAGLLTEHLALWPQAKTADTARLWLGRLRESQQDWAAAAAAYQGLARGGEQYGEGLRGAARCWTKRLGELQPQAESCEAEAAAAATFFETQLRHLLTDASQPWTADDRFSAEQAARLRLQFCAAGYAAAETVLQAALRGRPPPDATWQTTARSLLVIALAGQESQRPRAEQMLLDLGSAEPARLLEILAALSEIAAGAPPAARRDVARLQLVVVEKLTARGTQIDEATRSRLQRVRAEALTSVGRQADALPVYAELVRDYPDSGDILEAYATLLTDSNTPAHWQQALDAWRRLAARSRPESDRWYRAKYFISLTLCKLGDQQEAARRIRYLQTTTPALAQSPWQAEFTALLQQCQ